VEETTDHLAFEQFWGGPRATNQEHVTFVSNSHTCMAI